MSIQTMGQKITTLANNHMNWTIGIFVAAAILAAGVGGTALALVVEGVVKSDTAHTVAESTLDLVTDVSAKTAEAAGESKDFVSSYARWPLSVLEQDHELREIVWLPTVQSDVLFKEPEAPTRQVELIAPAIDTPHFCVVVTTMTRSGENNGNSVYTPAESEHCYAEGKAGEIFFRQLYGNTQIGYLGETRYRMPEVDPSGLFRGDYIPFANSREIHEYPVFVKELLLPERLLPQQSR